MVGGLDSSSCSTVELKGISISLWFCIANISCNGLFYKLVQICSLIITSFSHHSQLSVCVCRIWLHLNLFYFCLSEHPACPSIPPWLFWQFHQPLLSVCLSVLPWLCWQLLGLMPSQCSAPSWPMERRLHSLSRWTGNHSFSHFFSSKVYFTHFPTCFVTQSLFFCHFSPSPSSSIADHRVAGKLTESRTGRRTDRNIEILWRALLRKSAN